MQCSRCNTKFCYKCHKKIDGYDHFGQQCVLFDDAAVRAWNLQMGGQGANRAQVSQLCHAVLHDPVQVPLSVGMSCADGRRGRACLRRAIGVQANCARVSQLCDATLRCSPVYHRDVLGRSCEGVNVSMG